MADVDELGTDMAYAFFKEAIVPHGVLRFQERNDNTRSYSTPGTGEPIIITVLIKCITEYQFSKPQVRSLFFLI